MNLSWTEQLQKFFRIHLPETPGKIPAGIYHFRREAGGNITRFHLRVEDDGSGLLLANSTIAARLSPSGVVIAKGLLEGKSAAEIREQIHKKFRAVHEDQLRSDLQRLQEYIETLANPEDNYPIFNFDDPALSVPHSLIAPFHAQLQISDPAKTNPLLQKLWDAGVMHVTFNGFRNSSLENAVQNIERAEDLGMISGLRGVATWLQTPDLMRRAAMAGVDYLTIPVVSMEKEKHDGFLGQGDFQNAERSLQDCVKYEVCSVLEVPIFRSNHKELERLIPFFQVKNILCYAITNEYQELGLSGIEIIQAALLLKQLAETSDVRYIWQPPVSAKGELGEMLTNGPRTAGDISIRVDPDGNVYPARGPMVSAGNLLNEDWNRIWNRDVFRKYRERVESSTRCEICPGLEICAADCPADPKGWAREL